MSEVIDVSPKWFFLNSGMSGVRSACSPSLAVNPTHGIQNWGKLDGIPRTSLTKNQILIPFAVFSVEFCKQNQQISLLQKAFFQDKLGADSSYRYGDQKKLE